MLPTIPIVRQTFRGFRVLGISLALKAALYPARKAYHLARLTSEGVPTPARSRLRRFIAALNGPRHPEPPSREDFAFAGDLLHHRIDGQMIELVCDRGVLQITVLAPDMLRVRYRSDGQFEPPFSYAVTRGDEEWPAAHFAVVEAGDDLDTRTDRLVCQIGRKPCRLSFLDLDGTPISADTDGIGCAGGWVGCWRSLPADERIYGLGEKAAGLDHHGRRYEMWNTDPQTYSSGDDPLYMSFPLYLGLRNGTAYGLFFDNAHRSIFDVGRSSPSELSFLAEGGEMRYYFIHGPAMSNVLERYTELTGRMYLPPAWALGYHQNRWSYYPEARVRELAAEFRRQRIPCDAIHLDIHYMDGYRNFTWNRRRFPDPRGMIADLAQRGFKTVAMIDAGFKVDHANPVCADGLRHDVFLKHPDGRRFKGPVWPGDCYFPDYTDPQVREWFGDQYAALLDVGIAGIWNDMNEPAIISTRGASPPDHLRHDMDGHGGDHGGAHNVYGMQMARATCEGLRRLRPDRRPFIITRSAFAGIQRYALGWTADNKSTWESLALTVPMVLNLGLSGLAFTGPDTGGFEGDCSGELLARWNQLSLFTPLFRNHTALLTADQEPWAFGEPYTRINRQSIELRYRFLPAIYTAFWQCTQTGLPMMRPLFMDWQADERCATLEDQFLFGDYLLAAPVLTPATHERPVYLPAGEWYDWWTDERYIGPADVVASAPLDRLPLYVRAGAVIPMGEVMQFVGERAEERRQLHVYAGNGTSHLYEDAGDGWEHIAGHYRHSVFRSVWDEGVLILKRTASGHYAPAYRAFEVVLHGLGAAPTRVLVDGNPARVEWDEPALCTVVILPTDFETLVVEAPAAGTRG